jgi:hypothetical protein
MHAPHLSGMLISQKHDKRKRQPQITQIKNHMGAKEKSYYCLQITTLGCFLVFLSSCQAWAQPAEYSQGQAIGTVTAAEVTEASGMVASRTQPDLLWVHNDSGHSASIYAVTPQGTLLASYGVAGATMRDWEDIALGPGPKPEQDYLYIGDVGDNQGHRESITVYRIPEPKVQSKPTIAPLRTDPAQALRLVYPDGPRDAETLLVDPLTKDLYIISKRDLFSRVYHAPYPHSTESPITLKLVTLMPWGFAVGGDISPDGQAILVRGMFNASQFKRVSHEPLWKAFRGSHERIPIQAEPQGEAICFDAHRRGYYTLSEGKNQPIYYYQPIPLVNNLDKNE